jgi:arsenate reductase (thioredoxin)
MSKPRILILCTGNSCRSQLAEALWRHVAGDQYEVMSAGVVPKDIHPLTLKVLAEIGVSTTGLRSKHVDEFFGQHFDLVITVCDPARDQCPVFPGQCRHEHWPFDDPPATPGTEAEVFAAFRRVRDEIRARIEEFVQSARKG